MGLLRNSLALLRPEQKAGTTHATIPTWTSGMPQVQPTSFERYAREGYQRNELVWGCVEQLCTSVAEPRLKAYRKAAKADGKPIPVEQHPILDLFERPNPFLSRSMFWQMAMLYRSIAGNGFVEKVRSRGTGIVELWWWRPDRVKVIPDSKTFVKGYQIQVGSDIFELPASDVIHFKNRVSLDEFYGMAPMQVAAGRVDTDNYMREFTRSFFTNAGVPAGMLNIMQKQKMEDRELIRARFRQDYAGPSGWHNLMVIDGTEASYTQMGMPLGDRGIAMPELDSISEARIAMCFGVPLSLLGAKLGMSSSSYANRVADQKSFWEVTLIPIYREFAATINTYLVPEFEGVDYVEFDMDDVKALEEDRNEYHERVRKDFTAGLIGRQQTRDLLGYAEPDKDDVYLVPVAMTPEPVTPEPEPEPAPVVSQPPQLGPGVKPVDARVPGKPIPPGQEPAPGGGIGAGEGNTQPGAKTIGVRHDYATTHVTLPPGIASQITAIGAKIPDEDLAKDGREDNPHVTVKYGLHTDDPDDVQSALDGEKAGKATLGKTSIFPAKDANDGADVVKIDVDSQDLHRLNGKLTDGLEHTDTHPTYQPHVTVAYVKPGLGQKYAGIGDVDGQEMTFNHVVFADHDGKETRVPLGKAST